MARVYGVSIIVIVLIQITVIVYQNNRYNSKISNNSNNSNPL